MCQTGRTPPAWLRAIWPTGSSAPSTGWTDQPLRPGAAAADSAWALSVLAPAWRRHVHRHADDARPPGRRSPGCARVVAAPRQPQTGPTLLDWSNRTAPTGCRPLRQPTSRTPTAGPPPEAPGWPLPAVVGIGAVPVVLGPPPDQPHPVTRTTRRHRRHCGRRQTSRHVDPPGKRRRAAGERGVGRRTRRSGSQAEPVPASGRLGVARGRPGAGPGSGGVAALPGRRRRRRARQPSGPTPPNCWSRPTAPGAKPARRPRPTTWCRCSASTTSRRTWRPGTTPTASWLLADDAGDPDVTTSRATGDATDG